MKIKLPIINTLLLVAILAYLVISSFRNQESDRQAYVVTGELFSEFDYQKELDSEYKAIRDEKLSELELLKQDLMALEQSLRIKEANEQEIAIYQQKYSQFAQVEDALNRELSELNSRYSLKIWDKLNSLVSQYGEEQQYDVIFGASGSGNIMYANQKNNITEELIAFCNLKYNGK